MERGILEQLAVTYFASQILWRQWHVDGGNEPMKDLNR